MNRNKYLFKNTFIFALGNIGTKLITFFLVPMYTAVFITEQYGVIDFVFTICSFVVPIIILNINESVMRFSLDKDSDQNSIMSVGLIVLVASVFLAGIFAYGVYLYEPTRDYYLYIYFYAVFYGFENIFFGYLRGKELLFLYSLSNIIQTLLIAILNIIFLLYFHLGVKGYFLAYIITFIIMSFFAFFCGNIIDVIKHFRFRKSLFKQMVKYSIVLIPNSCMWWIMNSVDRVMLTSMIGVSITGLYAVANKIPQIISIATSVFNQAFSYSAIKEDNSKDREHFNNVIFDNLLFVMTSSSIAVFVVLKPFMSVYVSEAYYDSWIFVPPLVVGTGILALATLMASQYTVNKDSKGYLCSATTGAVINIILNYFLIPKYDAMGAAIATCVSYIVVFVYRYFDIKKYLKFSILTVKHILTYFILFASGFVVYATGIISYVILCILLIICVLIYRQNLSNILNIIKNIFAKSKRREE